MARRIFELALELGVNSRVIIARCHAAGVPESVIKNHMSSVGPGLEATIREWFDVKSPQQTAPIKQTWSPITDLPGNWPELSDPQLPNMFALWREREAELRDGHLLSNFVDRLRRQWAIETGILERLYTVSDSATEALIEKGLDSALLTSADTGGQDDRHVMDMIRDQKDAIDAVYQLVTDVSPLTPLTIRQLHQIITRHQSYSEGIDSLGQTVRKPMPRGEWKRIPNRVERADGTTVEFCPPLHVESQIDQLLTWHNEHADKAVPPEIEAAWLHHRFTQIHPFEDGNGRIARCLATLITVKAGWFPIVITRTDRVSYISALRAADRGDLAPLVAFFSALQRKAIRDAFDLGAETIRSHAQLSETLASIRTIFKRREEQDAELRSKSEVVADTLCILLQEHMRDVSSSLTSTLREINSRYWAPFSSGDHNDNNAQFNTFQTIDAAKRFGYFANVVAYHAWAKIDIRAAGRWEILVTIHGSGKTRGFFAAAAMLYRRIRPDQDDSGLERTRIDTIELLSREPFEFTYLEEVMDVKRRFQEWVSSAIQSGLELWQQHIA